MSNETDAIKLGPMKVNAVVEKWNDGRTPDDGEPDEVVEVDIYYNEYGEVETDPEHIEELKELLGEGSHGSAHTIGGVLRQPSDC